MEDLLIADQMELLYNDLDIPAYLHYNGNGTNPDLTLASADIADDVEREVVCDPGSGHRMIITGIGFDTSNSSKRPFRNRWNFAKADWKNLLWKTRLFSNPFRVSVRPVKASIEFSTDL
ncbi:hypothetical protein TNCV_2997261 [Trichonephila clavipes]|nr:hypothetical protein TNCV_2997261 [Trichonephila clavipes]